MEYIIQFEPQDLEALRDGQTIGSDIPPAAGDVRSYRIVVGTKPLPHDEALPIVSPTPPKALSPDPAGKPLPESPALFVEQQDVTADAQPQPETTQEEPSEETARPWLPLTLTLFGLFTSVGVNIFLGWVAWDFHRRYHAEHVAV